MSVTKAKLEGLFADELALLQPSPGYMRLLKESVLQIWKARKAAVRDELANAERAAKAIQDKLDRLDEAFLFERSIDIETYDRHAEKLREELTLARIDRHSGQLEELDVEGILAFAERILPRAADLWVQASLDQRQRFQQLFFPNGIAFDGNRFVGTGAIAPAFSYLREIQTGNDNLVDKASEELRKQVPFITDDSVQRYVSELGRRLVDNLPESLRQPAFTFSFEVLDRPDLAAFALPGGAIFMSRGMIAAAASEDELAGLLAHLASHVVLRHATAQASAADDHLPGPVSGRIIVAAARSGGGVLAKAANFAVASYFLTYSPEHERQADLAAMRALERAGYDAAAVAAIRRTIAAAGAEQGGAQWLLGHPNTAPARGSGGSATRAAASRGERPRLASDAFLAIQRRLGELSISRTDSMTVYRPRIAGAAYGIAVPSGEYRRETVGGRLALNVPANWRRLVMGTAVAFEPDGASQALRGGVSLTHGVQIGVARSLAGDLQRDLEALLQHLGRANSQVRWTSAFQRTQIAERRAALTTSFTSVSVLTGRIRTGVDHCRAPARRHVPVRGRRGAARPERGVRRRVRTNRGVDSGRSLNGFTPSPPLAMSSP